MDKIAMSEVLGENEIIFDINKEQGFITRSVLPDSSDADKALQLEYEIWQQHDYGDELEEYKDYLTQSRIYGSFVDDKCIGVVRVFDGSPKLPPFTDLPINDESVREKLSIKAAEGTLEELGTAAVSPDAPTGVVALSLWRLAYRDALHNGVDTWGIIMEPRRVKVMNSRYGFCFEQIGPEEFYQGGNCAAHTLDLHKVQEFMTAKKPDLFHWFVEEPFVTS